MLETLRRDIRLSREKQKAHMEMVQRGEELAAVVERRELREADKAAKEEREKEKAEREHIQRLTDQLREMALP